MKYLSFIFLLNLHLNINAQHPKQKLPRDSIAFYRQELIKLQKMTYDSLQNSPKYKELYSKVYGTDHKNHKNVRVELLANIGIYFADFTNLNARLKSIGQEKIDERVSSAGASLTMGFPIMTYGMELNTYVFDNRTCAFKGVHGRFFIGAHLLKTKFIVLNPQLGYGGSLLNMFIRRSISSNNFNDLFTTQSNTVQLSHSATYLDFALGFKLANPKKPDFYWQFLRVGYRYGLKEVAWSKIGGDFTDAPKDRNSQYYIQFCLGFDY